MDICSIATVDKRLLARRVGSDLAKRHGKKRYYSVEEVKAAARRQCIPELWDCWALSLYTSNNDFVDYHIATGEICDYAVMHTKMVDAVTTDAAIPDLSNHSGLGLGLPDLLDQSSTPVDFPASTQDLSVPADVPISINDVGGQTDASWFLGLLDALDGIDCSSVDW